MIPNSCLKFRPTKFVYAVATLVGSTVGVGFYGIPFTFQKAGLLVGLSFWAGVVGLVIFSNLLFGEVVLRTHRRHQFVGYVNKYLGKWAQIINLLIFWITIYGSLVGIIIISGDFLSSVFSPFFGFSPLIFSTIFIALASSLVFAGLKTVSHFDFLAMTAVILVVLLMALFGISRVELANFSLAGGEFWFLPFGVILFSMSSMSGVPLMRELLVGNERRLKGAIILGNLIPAFLYLVFTLIVLGISGESTSPDSISGLANFLGPGVVIVGSLLGLATSFTIFLNLATSLKETLEEDFRFKRWPVWLAVVVPPYLLFLFGLRNFIDVIGLVGGVAVGIQSVLMIFLYIQTKRAGERVPEYSIRSPKWLLYLIMLIFSLGAFYTLFIK